jgi:bleomycin hydrolase
MIRMGKAPIDISEMFTVRKVYEDKAEKYVRLHGYLNFAQGGALPDVMYVIDKYGAVPQEAYDGLNYGTDINRPRRNGGFTKRYS